MDDRGSRPPSRRTHALRDVAVIVLGGVAAYVLSSAIGLHRRIGAWMSGIEALQAEEVLLAFVAVSAAMALLMLLRYRDLRREVAARRRFEEALRVNEERYRNLVERVPAVTYVWDSGVEPGRASAEYVSPQTKTLFGFTHEEWMADPQIWHTRCHPEDRERVLGDWALAAAAGRPFGSEYRILAKDDRTVWIRDEAVPVGQGDSGKPLYQGVMFDITERRRAEDALRQAETQYRTLVEQIPAVTFIEALDEANTDIFVSPQIEDMLGYTPTEWMGDPQLWARRLHPEDRERVLRADRRFDRTGETFGIEYRILAKDDRTVWIREQASLMRDRGGEPQFWHGVMFDITELKATERQVREAEERYRLLVETMPAAVYTEPVDESSTMLYMSPRVESISGYPAEAWMDYGELWPRILHPDDREAALRTSRRTIETGEPYYAEYRIIRPDDSVAWIRDEAFLVKDPGGVPRYWQGFMLDITERKLAEERLEEAEERYRSLVEQLPVVVYIDAIDDVSTALYISPQYEALFGYAAEERIADPEMWVRMLHPDDREQVIAESKRTNETGEPFRMEYRLIAKDGREVWVRDEAIIVPDEHGDPRFWQGVLLDITQRKLAEERLGRRDAILGAVGFAAERFLQAPTWEGEIDEALARLGRGSGASRVHVFENARADDGSVRMTIRHAWTAPGIAATGARDRDAASLPRWEEVLGSGGVIAGHVREYPEPERRTLESEGVLSQVVVPVFVGDEWWGCIDIDVCDGEREWPQVEIDALRAAADTLGAAVGRERAERLLTEAETRYRSLVEGLPAVTYVHPPVGGSGDSYVSPQVEQMLGYPLEEWRPGRGTWARTLHPGDRDRVLEEDRRTDATGEPFRIEYRQVANDGRIVWIRDEAVLVRDEEDRPLFWQGVRLNITPQKEAEEQMREAEERFRTLVEAVPAITYVDRVDDLSSSVYISPQVEAVLGYTPDEWESRPEIWTENLHPDDRDRVFDALRPHNEDGVPFRQEYRVRHQDGHWVWIRDEALVLRDEEGRPRFSQGVMFDVTEQKEAEQQLRETQERFRALVEHIPAVLYVEEPDPWAPVVYVAPQVQELFGVSPEEYVADPNVWHMLVHPDDRDDVMAAYERALAEGSVWSGEYRVVRRDGSTIWVRDEAAILKDERGAPRAVQGVFFDITERKLAEEALRESERREREAAERLRMLDEMKNTFLAAVSHELRSPLTSILGLSLTLERQEVLTLEDRADLLGRLATNARKLDRLLKDLLDIDRLNRGIVSVQQRWADVGALARRTVESLEAVAGRDVVVEADPVSLPCDPAKVERIVENLVVNATRHTSEEARIWVRVRAEGEGALLIVEDEGPGVPEELKETVFEPFRQGPTTSPHAPGTGIGLSLVARFAELHGGRAWVEDRPGGGASFRVLLPGLAGNGDGAHTREPRFDAAGG